MYPKVLVTGVSLVGGVSAVVGGILYSVTKSNDLEIGTAIESESVDTNLTKVSRIKLNSDKWGCRIFQLEGEGGGQVQPNQKIIKEEVLDQVGFLDSLNSSHDEFKRKIREACSGTGSLVNGEKYGDPTFGQGGGVRYVLIYKGAQKWENEECGDKCEDIWKVNKGKWSSLKVNPDLT